MIQALPDTIREIFLISFPGEEIQQGKVKSRYEPTFSTPPSTWAEWKNMVTASHECE